MKEHKHILDNRISYYKFLTMTESIEHELKEDLKKLGEDLKTPKIKEIQYEIY